MEHYSIHPYQKIMAFKFLIHFNHFQFYSKQNFILRFNWDVVRVLDLRSVLHAHYHQTY
jgi:hypothetical protein